MHLKTNFIGEHNGEKFAVADGLLHIYGTVISLARIKNIIEIVTLLKNVHGVELRKSFPKMKPMSFLDQLHGKRPEFEEDEE